MPLSPLDLRERQLYKDTFAAYQQVIPGNDNGDGDIVGWELAPLSETDPTLMQNIPCNLHLTPNFDTPRSPAGLDKITSFETSNLLTCQRQVPLNPDFRIIAVSRYGDVYGFVIDGVNEQEVLVPCSCVFLVPDIRFTPLERSLIPNVIPCVYPKTLPGFLPYNS